MTRGRISIFVENEKAVEWADIDLEAYTSAQNFVEWIAAHSEELAAKLHMVEIEFLDEPDQNERYFRCGTDTARMGLPIGVDAGEIDAAFFELGRRIARAMNN